MASHDDEVMRHSDALDRNQRKNVSKQTNKVGQLRESFGADIHEIMDVNQAES